MPSVQIKNVPAETHAVLRRRAAEAHQSLQEYLRNRLIDEAAAPTIDEIFAEIDRDSGGSVSLEDAVRFIREDRDSR